MKITPEQQRNLTGIAVSVVAMIFIALAYFYPDVFEGNELRQHDTTQGIAVSHEVNEYLEATGERSWWTDALFGGMPTFQITPSYASGQLMSFVSGLSRLWLPGPAGLMFMMMAGFFILLLTMKVRWPLALPGAIAYGFSTYFIIIIGAGHIWKFITLAYIPPTIAGIVLCYRGRYLAGAALAAVYAMLQIAGNHIQMSYYFVPVFIGFSIVAAIDLTVQRKGRQWLKATGALIVAALLAVAANAPHLYNTYEYTKETMRGRHSDLTTATSGSGVNASGGLDKDYITAWSYGIDETLTLLIPNVKGGATLKPEKGSTKLLSLADTEAASDLSPTELPAEMRGYLSQMPQYFGDQPMTNGPVYVGALLVAFFILGCIIVKGPMKWMLLILTLLSIALAWGHNMMWLTDFAIDHLPMYNKFRTVASILVVAEFTIPLLAILGIKELLARRDDMKSMRTPLAVSFGVTMALCLVGVFAPSMFGSYLSAGEYENYVVSGVAQQVPQLFGAIEKVRLSLVSADSLRSFIILAIGLVLIWLLCRRTINRTVFCLLLTAVVIGDLVTVNKRYVNTDSFVAARDLGSGPVEMTPADRKILADTTLNYRVLDIPRFSESTPSYWHKTIGGYHPAKLTRYQDLIDRHLGHFLAGQPTAADMNVANMLNARYIVMGPDRVYTNPDALGNAWWVKQVKYVDTPDAEMADLSSINPAVTAVADTAFRSIIGKAIAPEPGDTIYETSYAPNRLGYAYRSAHGGIAVFSEIYFPWGWTATLDANTDKARTLPIGRVDYVLRAIALPAGRHTLTMTFDPPSTRRATTVATCSIIVIYLMAAGAIALAIIRPRRRKSQATTPRK